MAGGEARRARVRKRCCAAADVVAAPDGPPRWILSCLAIHCRRLLTPFLFARPSGRPASTATRI
eukprot:903682-Prymnesium_polylepis.1